MSPQITDTLLMVRPVRFGFNPQTAANNAFQSPEANVADPQEAALAEFDAFVGILRAAGVRVIVVSDRPEAPQPDSIFPNNWFSTHASGQVFLYPMFAPNRRAERRLDILQELTMTHGLDLGLIVDLSANELRDRFLEGTGSMVLDRVTRRIYACRSVRTDELLVKEFAATFGYGLELFDATDADGQPIYHTNVLMHVGDKLAVICLEAIAENQREPLCRALEADNKQIIPIRREQMVHYAGNMLEVRGGDTAYTVMSQQALDSLDETQRQAIELFTPILASPLDTIERLGGGSARCMMAEVFLPSM
jgi:hypothetical protein